ncbi:MAG: SAM-dependent methyltransferase [Trueperaceae bacterium]|nr:SAM-dependent methyltransferase [Trueperaceae bacterium]
MSCNTGLNTKLSARLLAVAQEIRTDTHLDIGSDHAKLPRYLLETARAKKVIVVEKYQEPFARAQAALKGYPADVRLGDGLKAVKQGEFESLSISGMGAATILKILTPEKLPSILVLQANDRPEILRTWALEHGYKLTNETMVSGFWPYIILRFEPGQEAAYEGLEPDLALHFGPLLLKQKNELLRAELEKQALYYGRRLSKPWAVNRLDLIRRALDYYD